MIAYLTFGLVSLGFSGRRKQFMLALVVMLAFAFCLYHQRYFYNGTYGFVRALICFNLGYFVYKLSSRSFHVPDYAEYLIPLLMIPLFFQLESYVPTKSEDLLGLFAIPLFFALSILALTKTNGGVSRLLETGPVQYLGRISYSVYLNHALLVVIIPRVAIKMLKIQPGIVNNTALLLTTLGVTLLYSALTYEFIEIKGGKWLSGVMDRMFPSLRKADQVIPVPAETGHEFMGRPAASLLQPLDKDPLRPFRHQPDDAKEKRMPQNAPGKNNQ
jgi:peptidoglycan/LPS O-acetylase OafA/YrhL